MKTQFLLMRETETADLIPVGMFEHSEVRNTIKTMLINFGGFAATDFREYDVPSWDNVDILDMLDKKGMALTHHRGE